MPPSSQIRSLVRITRLGGIGLPPCSLVQDGAFIVDSQSFPRLRCKEERSMESRFRWVTLLALVLVAVAVGTIAYNAGVSHGLAVAPAVTGGAPAGPGMVPYPPYFWYRPWGFGFGFGPLFFVVVLFLVIRPLLWGGFYGRRHYWRAFDVPPHFEDWHRRAHEKMNQSGAPSQSGS